MVVCETQSSCCLLLPVVVEAKHKPTSLSGILTGKTSLPYIWEECVLLKLLLFQYVHVTVLYSYDEESR